MTFSSQKHQVVVSSWSAQLSESALQTWWQETHNGLRAIELCDKPGEFSVTPICLHRSTYQNITRDLPKILQLARRISRIGDYGKIWSREDQLHVTQAYEDTPDTPAIGRPDGIFVGNQLKLLELNLGSGVGGFFEVDYVQSRFKQLTELAGRADLQAPPASPALLQTVNDLRENSSIEHFHIAILAYRHFRPYHVRQAHQLAQRFHDELRACSCHVVYADELHANADWISDGTRDYHMIWQFGAPMHPPELMAPVMSMQIAARSTKTLYVANPRDMAVEGKLALAALSENTDRRFFCVSDEEQALIDAYVPWTRSVKQQTKVSFQGQVFDIQTVLREHRVGLVLKRAHSKSTMQVYIGAEQDDATWQQLIDNAFLEDGQWVIQENLRSPALEFSYFDAEGIRHAVTQNFTYNQFVFGANCSAPLIRIERDPSRRKVAMAISSAMAITGTVLCENLKG